MATPSVVFERTLAPTLSNLGYVPVIKIASVCFARYRALRLMRSFNSQHCLLSRNWLEINTKDV